MARPSTDPYTFATTASNRVEPTSGKKTSGFQDGAPVPPGEQNDLFYILSLWIVALAGLFTANFWTWLGAPTFTSGAIARERSTAFSTWTMWDNSVGTVTNNDQLVKVDTVNTGTFTLKHDLSYLPDGCTVTGFFIDFEREGDAGEVFNFQFKSIQNAGTVDTIESLTIGDAANISGDLYRITVSGVDETLDVDSKRYMLNAFVRNGAITEGVRLLGVRITYTVPNLESAL